MIKLTPDEVEWSGRVQVPGLKVWSDEARAAALEARRAQSSHREQIQKININGPKAKQYAKTHPKGEQAAREEIFNATEHLRYRLKENNKPEALARTGFNLGGQMANIAAEQHNISGYTVRTTQVATTTYRAIVKKNGKTVSVFPPDRRKPTD